MHHPRARDHHIRTFLVAVCLLSLVAGCTRSEAKGASTTDLHFSAEMGSTYLYAKHALDVEVGLLAGTTDGVRLATFGDVRLDFTYLGSGDRPASSGTTMATAGASYLPAPMTQASGPGPSLSDPSKARGLYDAHDVVFAHAGWWATTVTADVIGAGRTVQTTPPYAVFSEPQIPAPGQRALRTKNLTISTPGVKPAWLDSVAQGPHAKVPFPWIHRWTIAKALAEHRPILVIFSTPAFCISQFCGPSTDAVARLAKIYANRAVFIHVEIYKEHGPTGIVPNQAAAQWLYRDGDLTEPWLYLIGANGIIQHQWGPLFSVSEVTKDLQALPQMKP